jgi:hypothetical protein
LGEGRPFRIFEHGYGATFCPDQLQAGLFCIYASGLITNL